MNEKKREKFVTQSLPTQKQNNILPEQIRVRTLNSWKDYSLLDCGNFKKVEKFGTHVLIRPEPQAVWQPHLHERKWVELAHAEFKQEGSHSGKWQHYKDIPERWNLRYQTPHYSFDLRLGLTGFKHIGVFPEQAPNWDYVYQQCKRISKPKVLNLFAYTGAATMAAAAAGAEVVHIDAIKQIMQWAKENGSLNNYNNIRWIVDDAFKFVERERRRGNRYEGILLDPPAFGHGPKGERWRIEDGINDLTAALVDLLNPEHYFFVLNAYSLGFSALILDNLVRSNFHAIKPQEIEAGELFLAEQSAKRRLPAGVYVRAQR